MKRYIILIVLIILSSIPLILIATKDKKENDLINETNSIVNTIKKDIETKEIDKNIEYDLNNESLFKKAHKGIAFVDINKKITVILESYPFCAYYKEILTNDVIIKSGVCDNYKLINNAIMKVVTTGNGLYEQDGKYIFKGSNVDNYVKYNDNLYQIISIGDKIRMVQYDHLKELKYSNDIALTIKDVESSSLVYISKDNYIITDSYLKQVPSWIKGEKIYYIYNDGNLYLGDNTELRNNRPIIELDSKTELNDGIGTLSYPYLIK